MSLSDKIHESLRCFEAISVGGLQGVAFQRRYDTKYLCSEETLVKLLGKLGDDYLILRDMDRLITRYQTLYFDTEDLRCFHDHRRGRRSRYKVRIRSYPERAVAFMEIKEKTNRNETRKHRLERSIDALPELSFQEVEAIEERTPFCASDLRPHLRTAFRRLTLVEQCSRERVTVDLDLVFSHQEEQKSLPGLAIVEVKQGCYSQRGPIVGALRSLGIRPTTVSKYCTGNALFGVDRSVAFYKEKFRWMKKVRHG